MTISLRDLNVVSAAVLAEGPWDGVTRVKGRQRSGQQARAAECQEGEGKQKQ